MGDRHLELRRLVRALRSELSRLHGRHRYAFDDESAGSLAPLHRISLEDVRTALRLADEGDYGTCIVCDGLISLERLKARPTAIRCLACQRRLEASTAA